MPCMASVLRITGLVSRPGEFDLPALKALPGQVFDISTVLPGREGGGVRLSALLDAVGPLSDARYITLEAENGPFSASVPIRAVLDQGLVVYRLGDGPLPAEKGGPTRFYIVDVESCGLAEVDACANVKNLARIDLSRDPGPDLRPTTQRDHDVLHAAQG